jgi:hypothetical protein
MSTRVALYAPFRIPKVCCVCLQVAEQSIEVRHSSFIPLGVAVRVGSSSIAIPFCAKHAHVTRRRMLCFKAGMIIFWILSVMALLAVRQRADKEPYLFLLPIAFFVIAIVLGFAERYQVPVRLKSALAAETRVVGSSPLALVILACNNTEFADVLCRANPTSRRLGNYGRR